MSPTKSERFHQRLQETSNHKSIPFLKRKDSIKDCKIALNKYLAFKGIVERRRQSAKNKDSTQSYNNRKKRWINTFLKEISKLRMCPAQKAKDSTKDCKKASNPYFSLKERFHQRLQKDSNKYQNLKGIVRRRRQSAKSKDSIKSYNKRKTSWNNIF